MKKLCGVILFAAVAAAAHAGAVLEWRFEVAAGAPRVVSCAVGRDWPSLMERFDVAAMDADGVERPVPWALDATGEQPELVFLADGHRSFGLVPKAGNDMPPVPGDVALCCTNDGAIKIHAPTFELVHPLKGGGGFPGHVRFCQSGGRDDGIFFLDRLVRKKSKGGMEEFRLKDCADSTARFVVNTPLRAVVETASAVQGVRTVCRYIYTADSPFVRVETRCEQSVNAAWSEVHTLHASWPRKSPRYTKYLSSRLPFAVQIRGQGEKDTWFSGNWVAYFDGTNAVGVASSGCNGYDASSKFFYYLVASRGGWDSRTLARHAKMYLGPALSPAGFSEAFSRKSFVTVLHGGRAWAPSDPLASPSGAVLLEGRGIRIAFDSADGGFGCLGIENRLGESAAFGRGEPGRANLWRLAFWRDGDEKDACSLDNRSPCAERTARRSDGKLEFSWRGLSLKDEQGTVDVVATVELSSGGDAAEWRIAVSNRSARWGLARSYYPVVDRMARPGVATALVPSGNWGGRLVPNYEYGEVFAYPRGMVPVQTLAFMLGEAGMQFTSLDGNAQEKTLDTSGLGVKIGYRCPDAGRPGAACAPDFAVETAAFRGSWWRAAKRYREWALKQKWAAKGPLAERKDFCHGIGDVGFWITAGNAARHVTNMVDKAVSSLDGIPLGVHWYCWHRNMFDDSYPEFFPSRHGVAEAVEWMKGRGVLVMPYINGRIWDTKLPNFAEARQWACKRPDGKSCYREVFGLGCVFAPMCPTTGFWRSKVAGICDRLMDEIGANAIYLDEISAAHPAACFDVSHGHPLGGGAYWTEGYREFMRPIRKKAVRRKVALTSENAAEPYMDSFDAFLIWSVRTPQDVPMLTAVYSGHALYFGSTHGPDDSIDAYCAQQGRDFLWGAQPGWQSGWTKAWFFDERHVEHLAFTKRLCRERLAHKDFFLEGELMGELPTPAGMATVEGVWTRHPACRFRVPAVMGTVWRARDGRRLVCLVNVSGEEQTFSYRAGSSGEVRSHVLPPRSVKTEVLSKQKGHSIK